MRVVAGRLGGRPLVGPSSDRVRPTSDRLRETLFNILEHGYGGVSGLRVIDLFAGTGALAIEALSRGASFALFVDDGADSRAAIRSNVEALGLGGVTRIFRRDARKLGVAPPGERFGLAFLDPPYGQGLADATLASLHEGGWLTPQAIVVVEEAADAALTAPDSFVPQDERRSGLTKLMFFRYQPVESA